MAWKRSVSNNQAGEIRKGHIKEFREPTSQSCGVTHKLKIISSSEGLLSAPLSALAASTAYAYIPLNIPPTLASHISTRGFLYLHAHKHPQSVIAAVTHAQVPDGCIVLSESHLVNSKLCRGERETFTIFQSSVFAYDGREGAIGNTAVRLERETVVLRRAVLEVRRIKQRSGAATQIHSDQLCKSLSRLLFGCIVTVGDVYITDTAGEGIVCRVEEVLPCEEEEDDFEMPDSYRGLVDEATEVCGVAGDRGGMQVIGDNRNIKSISEVSSVVTVRTQDGEEFTVKRRLLRPCISLTSVVQAGKGIYRSSEGVNQHHEGDKFDVIDVPVDACTFDRVLLYLEHEARGEPFKFDPLIASELLSAAVSLSIGGLQTCCEKVLGSFNDRVRRTPIRLSEVVSRNAAGAGGPNKRRTETLLILSGMVLDVSRWLHEHPGGSDIIPSQALNLDCTNLFEIYHASQQSFLYLKEFYIGELDADDGAGLVCSGMTVSDAFKEQLKRVTSWRIVPTIMNDDKYKSF